MRALEVFPKKTDSLLTLAAGDGRISKNPLMKTLVPQVNYQNQTI